MIYLYRPHYKSGFGYSYDILANGEHATTLYDGGYFPYLVEPGRITFKVAGWRVDLTLDIKPGETRFVKLQIRETFALVTAGTSFYLVAVSADVAAQEIANCRLIDEK